MVDLDGYADIAPQGSARQSSLSEWSLPAGAQALIQDHRNGFTIHTEHQDDPWWELDLLEVLPIQQIVICNRSDLRFQARASTLRVEVSRDGRDWTLLHAGLSHFGDGRKGEPMRLELAGKVSVRYLRLSLPGPGVLHLRRVQVLVARATIALARFSRQHGLRPMLNDPKRSMKTAPYKLISHGEGDQVTSLRIRRFGSMGNNFIQVLNAVHLARHLGVAHVIAPDLGISTNGRTITHDGVTLHPDNTPAPPGLCLEGSFFYPSELSLEVFASLTPARKYDMAKRFLVPLIDLHPDTSRDRSRELAIHIRSGDIFSHGIHPGYVQPPLSYYTRIVDEMRTAGLIDYVSITCEDRLNPCIDALDRHLTDRAIPCRIQSGSLREDVGFLTGARHLMFGFGTFGYGICLLAGQIDTVHVFDMTLFDGLPNVGQVTVMRPEPDSYISRRDWRCTPEQLQQMIDFPANRLIRQTVGVRDGAFRDGA